MNLKHKNVRQLMKLINRRGSQSAAMELAERIESGPGRSCIPKKRLRLVGLLPQVK